MRKYTVDEIDAMRSSLRFKQAWTRNGVPNVEEELRTHLLAGTSPDELEKHARATQERSLKARTDAIALEQKEKQRRDEIRLVVRDEIAKLGVAVLNPPTEQWARVSSGLGGRSPNTYAAAQKRRNRAFRSAMIRLFG